MPPGCKVFLYPTLAHALLRQRYAVGAVVQGWLCTSTSSPVGCAPAQALQGLAAQVTLLLTKPVAPPCPATCSTGIIVLFVLLQWINACCCCCNLGAACCQVHQPAAAAEAGSRLQAVLLAAADDVQADHQPAGGHTDKELCGKSSKDCIFPDCRETGKRWCSCS